MVSYKDSGVDIDEGNAFVDLIKPLVNTTQTSRVLSHLGGFSGVYDISFLRDYDRPVLVSSTDGVGTKIELARELGIFDTIGIDLVAMVVNDIVVQAAKPMFFLDYYATGKLNKNEAASVISGIAAGCRTAGCALIGGETAEMPGVYDTGKFDLAGFAVGFAEFANLLPRKDDICANDLIVGIPSSGLHSNGFSLVRKLISENKLELTSDLVTPTKIYVDECLATAHLVKAFVHITGGGFTDNVPRVLPSTVEPIFFNWQLPEIFCSIEQQGDISRSEMMRTFNCGFGMVAILDSGNVEQFRKVIPSAVIIGEIIDKG